MYIYYYTHYNKKLTLFIIRLTWMQGLGAPTCPLLCAVENPHVTALAIWGVLVCVWGGGSRTPVDIKVPSVNVIGHFMPLSLHIHELPTADQNTTYRYLLKRNPCVCGSAQSKPILFKGQLCITYILLQYKHNKMLSTLSMSASLMGTQAPQMPFSCTGI